jgi:glutathione S-transferase
VRLYNSAVSGNCYKVRWLLSLLGHDFETVELSVVDRSDREQKLGGKTPFLRLPLLELDDGTCLPESNAILCWLAEGTEYLPSDRTARARVMQWLFFEQNLHEPNIAVVRFWVAYAKNADEYPQPVELRTAAGNAVLETMDRHLAGNRWFAGENFTIAEIALYAYTHVADEGGFDLKPLANLQRWLADVAARPGHITIDS